jgi:hypothetical protein
LTPKNITGIHKYTEEEQYAELGGKISFVQTVRPELKNPALVEEEEEEEEEKKKKTIYNCIFWDITPCRTLYVLHAGFLLGVFFGPEVEAKYFSETSVDFERTTREEHFS